MRLAILILFLGYCQLSWSVSYRLNCDQCVSSALCQAINNYIEKFDLTKTTLKELAEELQTRFTSLQKINLEKSWDGKIDIQVSSVQPVYIIDLKHSDRVYVLVKTSTPNKIETRIVPALWINPTCLENLPSVCLNLKKFSTRAINSAVDTGIISNSLSKTTSKNSKPKPISRIISQKPGHGVISQQDLNLIRQIPAEFKEFLLALDPEISANYLVEWLDRNQIFLHYCRVTEDYNCKLIVRVNHLYDHQVLTPEFLARCLNLLPAELFLEDMLAGHKITGTSGLDNGLAKFSNFKTKKNSLKNFTIDLRFNKQIVILND